MSDFSKRCTAPGQASSEAAGLRWLREGSEAVVEVRGVDEEQRTLRIERVETVRPTRDAARRAVSYTHLTLPTIAAECRSRWSPYH